MPDTTNDIEALLDLLAAQSRFRFHSALTAVLAERDALREQLRLANIDQCNTEAEANDRDLRKDLICAALTGSLSNSDFNMGEEALASWVVAYADATLAAMRKGVGDGK